MKLCIDCQFFIVNGAKCGQSLRAPDYVRGHPQENYSAQVIRMSTLKDDCGPEAKHFKPSPVAVNA